MVNEAGVLKDDFYNIEYLLSKFEAFVVNRPISIAVISKLSQYQGFSEDGSYDATKIPFIEAFDTSVLSGVDSSAITGSSGYVKIGHTAQVLFLAGIAYQGCKAYEAYDVSNMEEYNSVLQDIVTNIVSFGVVTMLPYILKDSGMVSCISIGLVLVDTTYQYLPEEKRESFYRSVTENLVYISEGVSAWFGSSSVTGESWGHDHDEF